MGIARTVSDHYLGTHTENTVAALKRRIGVDTLSVVVLDSLDEYRELLVEVAPAEYWTLGRKLTAAAVLLTLILLILFVPDQTHTVERVGDTLGRIL